jgi:hypothetical protein
MDEQGTPSVQQIEDAIVEQGGAERFDIADERAQRVLDHRELYERLGEARTFLAQAKVNRILAVAGLLEGASHPKQYAKTIEVARHTVDAIVQTIGELTEHGLPEPSTLEIATSVPAGV